MTYPKVMNCKRVINTIFPMINFKMTNIYLGRVMSTESGSFASARTVVQLYLDNKDLGQVLYLGDCGGDGSSDNEMIMWEACKGAPGS